MGPEKPIAQPFGAICSQLGTGSVGASSDLQASAAQTSTALAEASAVRRESLPRRIKPAYRSFSISMSSSLKEASARSMTAWRISSERLFMLLTALENFSASYTMST